MAGAGIRILPEQVVNQIAAGEVIERPASVVKELVENSLDAGARVLSVHLEDGGRTRIRVVDDGHGMPRQDALMCLERHATSKIRAAEDLQQVGTLGFRGEAIPSIAAVSRFELRTRLADEEVGTRVRVEGGRLTDVREVATAAGTEIDVRSLFFNLPARKAFLRTRATELGHCVEAVTRQALIRPDVDVTLRHGSRELLRAAATDDPVQRATDALGADARRLVLVHDGAGEIEVVGLVAPPGVDRPTASGSQYLYVNGRHVRDPIVRRALRQAYRDLAAPGRYPLCVLDVRIDTERVDVNVHPTKSEVRFHDPRGVTTALVQVLREAILGGRPEPSHRPLRGGAARSTEPALPFQSTPPAWEATPPPWVTAPDTLAGEPPLGARSDAAAPPQFPPAPEPSVARGAGPSPDDRPTDARDLRLIGIAARRFVVAELGGQLLVIDGGRASRRVACAALDGRSQRLLVPCAVPVDDRADAALEVGEGTLAQLGLHVVRFSAREWAVKAVPVDLADAEAAELLQIAAHALVAGADPALAWAERLSPADLDPDDVYAVRTLLATARERGLPLDPQTRRMDLT